MRRLFCVSELTSSSSTDFEWLEWSIFANIQLEHDSLSSVDLTTKDLWTLPAGSIWISESDSDQQLRLCFITYNGPGGHCDPVTTEKALKKPFNWSALQADVRAFVRDCVHYLSTVGGEKIPRPFGLAVHETKANDLLQYNYMKLGATRKREKYAMMLLDNHLDYKWFFAFPETLAENGATEIIDWCAAFFKGFQ